ncbi:MAG TPA: GAF domain-containing sensor histidine kinase [Kofleriaceae bacterium]|nr:GAF domain-containing sensor histidine kinase [Kofleriaceae bacterium]
MGETAGTGPRARLPPSTWRAELIDPALTALTAAFAVLLAIVTPLLPPPHFRAPFIAIAATTLLLLALRLARRLPLSVRAGGAALATLVAAMVGATQLGIGPGLTIGLAMVGAMVSISLGRAASFVYFALAAAGLLVIGVLAVRGGLSLRAGVQDPNDLSTWVRWVVVFTVCSTTLAVVLDVVVRRVERSALAQLAADEEHERCMGALLGLAQDPAIESGRVGEAFAAISEAAARGLDVARAGVWRIGEGGSLRCDALFSLAGATHAAGATFAAADHAALLAALAEGRAVAAELARTDPRTRELADYLAPPGVTSLLIAPIRFRDRLAGMVCHEQVGERRAWSAEAQGFAASLADFAARALAAAERAQREEELRDAYDLLGRLHRQVENAKEEERRHIARELHDELGQTLTALKLRLQMAHKLAGKAPAVNGTTAGGTVLGDALEMVDRLIGRSRQLSMDLSPPLLDEVGLAPAIRAHLERTATPQDLRIDLHTTGLDERLPAEVETAAFRVVQESLTNAFRHADARLVEIRVRRENGHLQLLVHDDGRGFDVAAARRAAGRGKHFGVVGMAERVKGLGGTLEVRSTPGGGTEVRASLPVAPPR